MSSARLAALDAMNMLRRGTFSSDALDAAVHAAKLEPRDAALCQRMRQIKAMPPEELAALKRRTHQSVLSAGATDLARKILPIYEGLCRKEERA